MSLALFEVSYNTHTCAFTLSLSHTHTHTHRTFYVCAAAVRSLIIAMHMCSALQAFSAEITILILISVPIVTLPFQ